MCGIVGVFGDVGSKEEDIFEDMLQLDVIRGQDSTGVLSVSNRFEANIIKDVALPQFIIEDEKFRAAMKRRNILWLGHNRAATKGKILKRNAHPFARGRIVGVHNGTLWNVSDLDGHAKFDTDSEAIINTINSKGIERTWPKVNGAAVLVWWDKKDHSLHFIRNKQRGFAFCLSKDEKTLYFASETWMITSAATRNGRNVDLGEMFHPNENYHFTWRYEDGKVTKEAEYIDKPLYRSRVPATGGSRYPRIDHSRYGISDRGGQPSDYDPYGWGMGDLLDDDDDENYVIKTSVDKNGNRHTTYLPKDNKGEDKPAPGKAQGQAPTPGSQGGGVKQSTERRVVNLQEVKDSIRGMTVDDIDPNKPDHRDLLDKKGLSPKRFYKKYKNCAICRGTLKGDYKEAAIIDDHTAVCGNCVTDAEAVNVDLHDWYI